MMTTGKGSASLVLVLGSMGIVLLLASCIADLTAEEAGTRTPFSSAGSSGPLTRLSISDNGRHLIDQNHAPVYLLGGTAWTLTENATREDVDHYLDDRKSKGFNYVQVVAVRDLADEPLAPNPDRTMNPVNRYGHRPFRMNAESKADPSRRISLKGRTPDDPNDYWDHLEYIVKAAYDKNIYVGLLPTWGKYYVNTTYDGMRLFSEDSARSYGRFLGRRYRKYPNIIWILGGDVSPVRAVDGRPIYRAMAEGLVAGKTGEAPAYDEEHPAWSSIMITYHAVGAAALFFNDDAWLKLNMVVQGDPDLYDNVATHYRNTPTRPMLHGESWYEGWVFDGTHKDARVLRRQMHHAFLGGTLGGYVYGVASSSATSQDQVFRFRAGWRDRLDLRGALEAAHFRALLDDRQWWRLVPDQTLLLSGRGSGQTLKAAARSLDGDELLVYFPEAATADVDTSAVTSHPRARVTWHDPQTGEKRAGGVVAAAGSRSFISPDTWEDALLILEGTEEPLQEPPATDRPSRVFKTIAGEVVLAAESYSSSGGSGGQLGTWSAETTMSGFLGESYMRSSLERCDKAKDCLTFNPGAARLDYVIDFEQKGTYHVHLRTLARDHTENGFFATLDGKEIDYGGPQAYFIYVKKSEQNKWNWYTDGGGAEARGLRVRFDVTTPGRHTFSIYRRESGSRVDHIWLTKNAVGPQNTASLDLPDPSLFIAE